MHKFPTLFETVSVSVCVCVREGREWIKNEKFLSRWQQRAKKMTREFLHIPSSSSNPRISIFDVWHSILFESAWTTMDDTSQTMNA